jgi:hypothetical protein
LAAAVAVIVGVPGWLEAILWAFLIAVGIWIWSDVRKRRRTT